MSAFILVFAHRYLRGDRRRGALPASTACRPAPTRWRCGTRRSAAIRRGGRSPSARPAATSTRTSASDERLLLAHQPHLLRHGAPRGAVDRRRHLHRQPRGDARRRSAELQRGIDEAATLVDEYRKFSFETFGRDARLIADLPVLKAAVDTHDPATVEPIAREYQNQLANADLFAIADNRGRVLVAAGHQRRARRGARGRRRPSDAPRRRARRVLARGATASC